MENKLKSVIHTIKREDPYVRISNSIFQDKRISYKAKGILSYLLSKPNNWQTRIQDLYNNTPEGYTAVRSGISELLLTGYMEMKNVYDPTVGGFTGRFYIVMEEPYFTEGYRKLENKNKSYKPDEQLVTENPILHNRMNCMSKIINNGNS